ncbi:GNAT family N-acetyltransferase [Nitrospirillum iridis]|uniref:Phosphinothricin acetyltransferase n=1 Tax=Nitrospirillum iridis TaxID=765888 RepID=A0A7X0AZE7_9PROT|nr:GNAT family N-acetyltransferase [Nitrospirillum iridis]MBB6252161.1 phosphinothricin acetyltransferase [Nitrospirillum iridis]
MPASPPPPASRPPPGVHIREANAADLPRIVTILNEAIIHTTAVWSLEPTSVAARTPWLADRQARGFPVLVATPGPDALPGEVLGFASYGDFRPFAGYLHTVENSLYVDEAARGRGVGTALLSALLARATAARLHVMIAGIEASNLTSIRLHQRFGFQETGRLRQVGRKFDRWLDLVFLQKILS